MWRSSRRMDIFADDVMQDQNSSDTQSKCVAEIVSTGEPPEELMRWSRKSPKYEQESDPSIHRNNCKLVLDELFWCASVGVTLWENRFSWMYKTHNTELSMSSSMRILARESNTYSLNSMYGNKKESFIWPQNVFNFNDNTIYLYWKIFLQI